jgi:hypothetical protein
MLTVEAMYSFAFCEETKSAVWIMKYLTVLNS